MVKRQKISTRDKKFLRRICLDYLERFCLHAVPGDRNELVNLPPERFNWLHREEVGLVQRLGKKYLLL